MVPLCDHKSVGVIITNQFDEVLLLERARLPWGLAPPAGHIDGHGGSIEAAIAEVFEEVGIKLQDSDLTEVIFNQRVDNICRRPGGTHHIWSVYEARVEDLVLRPDPTETNGAAWYTHSELDELIKKTEKHTGNVKKSDMPILERIWLNFFSHTSLSE